MNSIRIAVIGDASSVNVRNWCDGLRATGAEVHIISLHAPNVDDPFVHPIIASPTLKKLRYFVSVFEVRRLLRKIKPDIVNAYFATGYGTLGALSGFHPLVITTAGSDVFVGPRRNALLRSILRFNFQRAGMIIAFAPHIADAILQLGGDAEKIVIQPRGISLTRFGMNQCYPPSENDTLQCISTRSLAPTYNLDSLLNAVPLLNDITCHVTIVGDGPLRNRLEQHAEQIGIGKQIDFVGRRSQNEIPSLLAKHNTYIALTETEGVSASLLEAMAVGLTPIVFDIEANRYWITHGENGLLIKDRSPETISNALRQVYTDLRLRQRSYIQNPQIVKERADLFRNSQVYVDKFRRLLNSSTEN
jgi:L-malate glycosyltransferase